MRRRASRWSILILAALLSGASPADDVPAPPDAFDCADAFDLIAMTVMLRCATWPSPPDAEARIAAVRERLVATGLAEPQEFVGLRIAFCPLVQGTGMVPDPAHLYLDDGLLGMSVDGLAEIVVVLFAVQYKMEVYEWDAARGKVFAGQVRRRAACDCV